MKSSLLEEIFFDRNYLLVKEVNPEHGEHCSVPVCKARQIFQNVKFRQMYKNINKFNFPFREIFIQISMGEMEFLPLKPE